MTLEYRGSGERTRGVARRKCAALTGRAMAPHRVLDGMHERLRDDLRADQIEADVREPVRGGVGIALGEMAADHVQRQRRPDLKASAAQDLAGGEDSIRRRVADDVALD